MINDNRKSDGFLEKLNKTVTPIFSAIAAIVALISRNSDSLIRYSAIIVSVVLMAVLLFPALCNLHAVIKEKYFPRRLTKDQEIRLKILLRDSLNFVSMTYVYSPFSVWASCRQRLNMAIIGVDQDYQRAIEGYLLDMLDIVKAFPASQAFVLRKMSFAVRCVSNAGVEIHRDLEALNSRDDISKENKTQIKEEWNHCATHLNGWLNDWVKIFKEANDSIGASCIEYIPSVRLIN